MIKYEKTMKINRKGEIGLAIFLIASVLALGVAGVTALKTKQIEEKQAQLGAFRPSNYVGKLLTRLNEGGAESTFRTTPNTAADGSSLTNAKLGDFIVFTINPGASNEEKISVSAVATSTGGIATWTIISRGLSFTENAQVSANIKQHAIGETVIISNDDHYLNQQYVNIDDNQTITGIKTFASSSLPRASTTPTYTTGDELKFVTYGQLASTSFAGTVDGSETAKGIFEAATIAESSAGTALGSTGAMLIPQNKYFSATSSATTSVPVTKSTGKLDQGYINLTESWTIAGTSTLSNSANITVSTATSTATTTDRFNLLPAGVVQMYASSSAPAGWLLADGTEYATSSYPRLWQMIQYVYGGSTSTFRVPDIRGRFVAGPSSTLSTTLGATGGKATSTVTGTITTTGSGNAGGPLTNAANGTYNLNSGMTTSPAPYIILNYIIKY